MTGKFNKDIAAKLKKPNFCLYLTTNKNDYEFNQGCILTGMLERGNRKTGIWESTHYACVKK